MEPLLAARRVLREKFAKLHRKVLLLARDNEVCQRLMTIPGVGPVSLDLHRLGLMTHIDRAALAAYCDSYGLWIRTRRLLAKIGEDGADGLLTKTVQGNVIQNPLIGIVNKAKRDMMAYAEQFGMTPSSRARLLRTAAAGWPRSAEKYFSAGPRGLIS